jgi:hypothetical protein
MTRIETYCAGTPSGDRLNEDTYFLAEDGHFLLAAVMDGVTDRLKSDALRINFETHFRGEVNGSRYAALVVRESLMTSYWYYATTTPSDLLLDANAALRSRLESVYGRLNAADIYQREPALAPYQDDPRYFRLILPATVATIARINVESNALEYAHLGDTELLLFYKDGRAERAIVPQRPNAAQGAPDVIQETDPQVAKFKQYGFKHNYTDTYGQTDPSIGVGVVNGMIEARDYLITGRINLMDVVGVVVCSDGFMWPQLDCDCDHMRQLIEAEGLRGYVIHLRAEEASDPERERYPRPKVHDDATAIYIQL